MWLGRQHPQAVGSSQPQEPPLTFGLSMCSPLHLAHLHAGATLMNSGLGGPRKEGMSSVLPLTCCTPSAGLTRGNPSHTYPRSTELRPPPNPGAAVSGAPEYLSQQHTTAECHYVEMFEPRHTMLSDYITFCLKSFSGSPLPAESSPSFVAWPPSPLLRNVAPGVPLALSPMPCTLLSNHSLSPCMLESNL